MAEAKKKDETAEEIQSFEDAFEAMESVERAKHDGFWFRLLGTYRGMRVKIADGGEEYDATINRVIREEALGKGGGSQADSMKKLRGIFGGGSELAKRVALKEHCLRGVAVALDGKNQQSDPGPGQLAKPRFVERLLAKESFVDQCTSCRDLLVKMSQADMEREGKNFGAP